MKIRVGDYEIPLDNREVKLVKNQIAEFLLGMKTIGDKYQLPSFYFTTLIVTHIMTAELLDDLSSKELEDAMKAIILIYDKNRKSTENRD